jgi:hypothetical protein
MMRKDTITYYCKQTNKAKEITFLLIGIILLSCHKKQIHIFVCQGCPRGLEYSDLDSDSDFFPRNKKKKFLAFFVRHFFTMITVSNYENNDTETAVYTAKLLR